MAATTRWSTPWPATRPCTDGSPPTAPNRATTKTAPDGACPRPGTSGTRTRPSAGRPIRTRCWKPASAPATARRAMPGAAWTARSSTAPPTACASKKGMEGRLREIAANVYYSDVDHVMDNYTLRAPDPDGAMPMPMASNVAHRTSGGRAALGFGGDHWELTAGVDARNSRHARRSAMGRGQYLAQPWTVDARFRQAGAFAELHWHLDARNHLIAGARVDRAEAEDRRASTGGMMPMPNPTLGQTRSETLPSAFVRFEQDIDG